MSDNIIRPGHYRLKSSFNSDTAKIIRIMGQDPQNPNFWLTIEGERYSDYDLQSGYVLLNTSAKEDIPSPKTNMKKVFQGLGTPSPSIPSITTKPIETNQKPISNTSQEISTPADFVEVLDRIYDKPKTIEEEILEKCFIENINRENFTKHGIDTKLKPKLIEIDFQLEIPYDMDRLKKSVKLLDLDVKSISKILTKHILGLNIEQIIEYRVHNLLLETDVVDIINETQQPIKEINTEPGKIQEPEKIQESELSDSDFLHSFVNEDFLKNL